MKKYKYIIFILALVVLLLPQVHTVLAATEVQYPVIPGAPAITSDSSLGQYIQYFFVFSVAVAGIIGVISIVIAGISLLASAGNPSAASAAKERIYGSILGIVLLMCSFILLRTINTNLITPKTLAYKIDSSALGIYWEGTVTPSIDYPAGEVYSGAAQSMLDTRLIASPFTKIFYYCPPGTDPNTEEKLLVWTYDKTLFGVNSSNPASGATTIALTWGPTMNGSTSTNITGNVKSYKFEFQDPGVYFYLSGDCTGLRTPVQKSDTDIPLFSQDQFNQIRSMEILSGDAENARYGVVLNKAGIEVNNNTGGECSAPIINSNTGSDCINPIPRDIDGAEFNPKSAFIFTPKIYSGESGPGIWVYGNEKSLPLPLEEIKDQFTAYAGNTNGTPDDLLNHQGNDNGEGMPQCISGAPGQTCINSIITGNGLYDIFLYASNDITKDRSCQSFHSDANLANGTGLLDHGREIYRMDIIPSP